MVSGKGLALTPVDRLLAGYLLFLTLFIVIRGGLSTPANWWLILMHAQCVLLFHLFTRLRPQHRVGNVLHDLYPLILLTAFYVELGLLNQQPGVEGTFAHDQTIQGWEAAIFGTQVSYEWIRTAPSVFWSTVLHLAYFAYYPIIVVGPVWLVFQNQRVKGRQVMLATMLAFVACYLVFALYPVAGPNYTFEHPTGPVRQVWSAQLVYWILGQGSAFGTAFPSSHVAATVAATTSLWFTSRPLAITFIMPTILLVVGTVYCQMHYGVDAVTGTAVGLVAGWVGPKIAA